MAFPKILESPLEFGEISYTCTYGPWRTFVLHNGPLQGEFPGSTPVSIPHESGDWITSRWALQRVWIFLICKDLSAILKWKKVEKMKMEKTVHSLNLHYYLPDQRWQLGLQVWLKHLENPQFLKSFLRTGSMIKADTSDNIKPSEPHKTESHISIAITFL